MWPTSRRQRLWCVCIGVNENQQSCQQPPQCFYNRILIQSPHHPAELESAPVCLFLVRLLLQMGNKRQPVCGTYPLGPFSLSGTKSSQVSQPLCQPRHPPCGQRGEANTRHTLGKEEGAAYGRDTAPKPRRWPSPPEQRSPTEPEGQPRPSHACIQRHHRSPPDGHTKNLSVHSFIKRSVSPSEIYIFLSFILSTV